MFLSLEAQSWECLGKHKGMETSFENHVQLASEIYLGRVTNAYLVSDIYKIVFEFEVNGVFKGRYKSHKTLKTTIDGIDPDITIGNSYVFFLYGEDEVDFCGHHLNLGKRKYSFEKLKEEVNGQSILEASKIQRLKKLYELKQEKP